MAGARSLRHERQGFQTLQTVPSRAYCEGVLGAPRCLPAVCLRSFHGYFVPYLTKPTLCCENFSRKRTSCKRRLAQSANRSRFEHRSERERENESARDTHTLSLTHTHRERARVRERERRRRRTRRGV